LNPRTTSGYFIGYAMSSKGYRFYCLSYKTRIVKVRNVKFLKDLNFNGSHFSRMIEFKESCVKIKDLWLLFKKII